MPATVIIAAIEPTPSPATLKPGSVNACLHLAPNPADCRPSHRISIECSFSFMKSSLASSQSICALFVSAHCGMPLSREKSGTATLIFQNGCSRTGRIGLFIETAHRSDTGYCSASRQLPGSDASALLYLGGGCQAPDPVINLRATKELSIERPSTLLAVPPCSPRRGEEGPPRLNPVRSHPKSRG